MYVPARCSVSWGMFCAAKIAGVPPPETTGTGIPARLNSSSARSRNWRVPGSRLGKVMRPSKRRPPSRMAVRARSSAASGVCTPLRPKPVSHSTRNGISVPAAREAAGDDLVVEHDGQPLEPPRQRQQPLDLGAPEDVEGQQHVVSDAGLGEHLDLAELLAGDALSTGGHLHPAQ